MDLRQTIFFIIAIIISVTFHEAAHAWAAYQLGDPTAKRLGRLSLNPVVHFDPLGALMILFMAISGRGLGWGRPVPVNPANLRGDARIGMGLTSVIGPFSNLVLASLAAIPLRLVAGMPELVAYFLLVMVFTNVGLSIFNLIPLPPLDGYGVLQGALATVRTRWAYDLGTTLDRFAPYGPMVLLLLLSLGWFGIANPVFALMEPAMSAILGLLLG